MGCDTPTHFSVASGNCTACGNCFHSQNYLTGDEYDTFADCTIDVLQSGYLDVVEFDIDGYYSSWSGSCSSNYDFLSVDGTDYCRDTGPQSAYLTTSSNISFSTGNYGGDRPGFHICMLDDPPPSAVPTPAPTLMAVSYTHLTLPTILLV